VDPTEVHECNDDMASNYRERVPFLAVLTSRGSLQNQPPLSAVSCLRQTLLSRTGNTLFPTSSPLT
jgi:hypothetical protein